MKEDFYFFFFFSFWSLFLCLLRATSLLPRGEVALPVRLLGLLLVGTGVRWRRGSRGRRRRSLVTFLLVLLSRASVMLCCFPLPLPVPRLLLPAVVAAVPRGGLVRSRAAAWTEPLQVEEEVHGPEAPGERGGDAVEHPEDGVPGLQLLLVVPDAVPPVPVLPEGQEVVRLRLVPPHLGGAPLPHRQPRVPPLGGERRLVRQQQVGGGVVVDASQQRLLVDQEPRVLLHAEGEEGRAEPEKDEPQHEVDARKDEAVDTNAVKDSLHVSSVRVSGNWQSWRKL